LKKLTSKVIVALEGGYNLDSLSRCSEAIIRTLMNEPSGFNGVLLKKEVSQLNLNLVELTSNNKFFAPSYYAVDQVNSYKNIFQNYWKGLINVKTLSPNRNVLRKDDSTVMNKIEGLFKEAKDYLLTQEEKESMLKSVIVKSKISDKVHDEFPFEFLKFKIGKLTLPLTHYSTDAHKFKRRVNIDNRTLSRSLNFRLEGISLEIASHKISNNLQQCNWVKRDGIFDVSSQDMGYLISKFLVQKKINKNDLLEKLETLSMVYEKFLKEDPEIFDLYNVDILILPKDEATGVTSGVTTRSKKKKTEFSLKLNGLKEYSLTSGGKETDENNFYEGLRSLINFIKDNIID
jgi:hypothetical protein